MRARASPVATGRVGVRSAHPSGRSRGTTACPHDVGDRGDRPVAGAAGVVDVDVDEAPLGRRLVRRPLEQADPVDDRARADLVDHEAHLDRLREADLAEVAAAGLGDHPDLRQRADVDAGRLVEVGVDRRVEQLVVGRVVEVAVGVVVAPAGRGGAPRDVVGRAGGAGVGRGHSGRLSASRRPLADHGRDAVAAHRDAVERVADLHGALLVGDHEQLGVLAQLLVDLQQAAEVGVVERGLDLVEDVERRGPGLEERHQERHRDQRPLAAGEQREPLDLLARRPGLDLDAGGEHVAGVGEHETALAAGEEPGEGLVEGLLHVGVGLGEDLLDARVDLADDVEEVLAGALEVLELLGEELVPLLHRRELLERERVDPAEHRQRALGGAQPLDLLLAHERRGLGRLLALGHLAGERDGVVGP